MPDFVDQSFNQHRMPRFAPRPEVWSIDLDGLLSPIYSGFAVLDPVSMNGLFGREEDRDRPELRLHVGRKAAGLQQVTSVQLDVVLAQIRALRKHSEPVQPLEPQEEEQAHDDAKQQPDLCRRQGGACAPGVQIALLEPIPLQPLCLKRGECCGRPVLRGITPRRRDLKESSLLTVPAVQVGEGLATPPASRVRSDVEASTAGALKQRRRTGSGAFPPGKVGGFRSLCQIFQRSR